MRYLIALAALLAFNPTHAGIIDFQDVSTMEDLTELESGDFRFTADCCFGVRYYVTPGDTTLALVNGMKAITMESISGAAFSLSSFDSAGYYTVGGIDLTGYLAGGGTVQTNLEYGGSWSTLELDDTWQNLLRVEFLVPGTPTQIDNIIASTVVPTPTTAWLFGAGLLGLLGMSRAKK